MLIRLWSVSTGVTAVILGCLVHPHVARDAFISLLSGCCSSHLSPPTAILMTSNYFYFSACRSKRCCSGPGTEGPKLHRKLWRCWLGMYKHKGLVVKLRVLIIFHWCNHVCCVFCFLFFFLAEHQRWDRTSRAEVENLCSNLSRFQPQHPVGMKRAPRLTHESTATC